MTKLKLVTLQQFTDRMQAEMAKGLLDSAGIPSIISSADAGGVRPVPFAFGVGITLSVKENDLEKAKEVLSVMNS
jgi:hypothetical protein